LYAVFNLLAGVEAVKTISLEGFLEKTRDQRALQANSAIVKVLNLFVRSNLPKLRQNKSYLSRNQENSVFAFQLRRRCSNLENLRAQLPILWVINAITCLSQLVMEIFESGDTTHIGPIEMVPLSLFAFSAAILGLTVMAYLSQILSDKTNRWTNIIVGVVYVVVILAIALSKLMTLSVVTIIPAFGVIWSALAVWTAWKSK
jgi:hypothetical protein